MLLSTLNEDGSLNLAPMSSAWWINKSCVLGMGSQSKTVENLRRLGECVLNLPSADLVDVVDRLALTTGKSQMSASKQRVDFTYVADKFGHAELSPGPSELVHPPRVMECPVQLGAAMKTLVLELMPELLEVKGIGVVHAATLLAEAGDVRRFHSQHAFAMFCGCAPVERSSGGQSRRQLNIGGNRRLNRTFHMMLQVRLRCDPATRAYLDKKQQQGKTTRAALRCLKTYLARELFRFMHHNLTAYPQRWLSP